MKIFFWLIAQLLSSASFAQSGNPATVLIRHDTTMLKADKTIVETILQAIGQGKLKAVDCFTNQHIPARQVYTWRMSADTVLRYDTSGNYTKHEIVQQYRKAEVITQIRILQDWYFNVTTGQFISHISWIELLEEVRSSSGDLVGLRPFCRIYY